MKVITITVNEDFNSTCKSHAKSEDVEAIICVDMD